MTQCSLWIRHKLKSLPNQWLYYKHPHALGITKLLCCWPPSTSLALDMWLISSRCTHCLLSAFIAASAPSNTTSVITIDNIVFCWFQGHIYSLIGAVGDNRFALMHAGYKHTQGIDGFPKDLDMAYSYYSNAGVQSNMDSSRLYEKTVCLESFLESVCWLVLSLD